MLMVELLFVSINVYILRKSSLLKIEPIASTVFMEVYIVLYYSTEFDKDTHK